ncbi:MAG: ATP-binding cassette domain-containing protein [Lachnospiraceae bacterium]|nr:ATP-binding cassette domain-containing protein [Lachnospiraceae bacterium]
MNISLESISKQYDGTRLVLNKIDLVLPHRGLVFLLGKSGSGKTTLLNILAGLDKESSGRLLFDGESTDSFDEQRWDQIRSEKMGIVFQEYNLYPDLTVKENMKLVMRSRHNTTAGKAAMKKYLSETGVWYLRNKKVQLLSGGEKQRVAIARCLVRKPEVVLADEPTGNLDTENSEKVFRILKDLSEKCLVLVVTHDAEAARLYGDRIVRIQDGSVVEDTGSEHYESNNSDDSSRDRGTKRGNELPIALRWLLAKAQMQTKKTKMALQIGCMSLVCALVVWFCLILSNRFETAVSDYFQRSEQPYAEIGMVGNQRNVIGEVNRIQGADRYGSLRKMWSKGKLYPVRFQTNIVAERKTTGEITGEMVDEYVSLILVPQNECPEGIAVVCGRMPMDEDEIALSERAIKEMGLTQGDVGMEIRMDPVAQPLMLSGIVRWEKPVSLDSLPDEHRVYYHDMQAAAFVCETFPEGDGRLLYLEIPSGDFSLGRYASQYAASTATYTNISFLKKYHEQYPDLPSVIGSMPTKQNEIVVSYSFAEKLGLNLENRFEPKTFDLRSVRSLKSADYSMCFDICEYLGDRIVVVGVSSLSVDVIVTDEVYRRMAEEYCRYYLYDGFVASGSSFEARLAAKILQSRDIRVLTPDMENVYKAIERQKELRPYLYALLGISVVILGLLSAAMVWANAKDNHRKIGILRSLGIRRGNVASVFRYEAFIAGAVSATIGSVIGSILFLFMKWNYEKDLFWDVVKVSLWRINISTILLIVLLLLILMVAGAAVAAGIVSKRKTIDLLKE